ncbi:hypothetical protein E4U34_000639 [Claviceps purpurea]|nr:hypothetical protein E4U38_001739 [Claviceps purpurea]KAG6230455.1 hypothetical protein E4U34_000639 [Claviceps purpurea]
MDSGVAMILPKGIVVNTKTIYQEVASYPIVPATKIWEYWHVYTTTNKKLKDPTARRLENFWWQVWGSDRKFLSGRVLANMYENISVGRAFVPLHGPANRWEGPDVPPLTKQLIVAHVNGRQGLTQNRPEPPRTKSNQLAVRSMSGSASKPPPSHPILKKSRSPNAPGPRPTARFASPPVFGREDAKERHAGSPATINTSMTSTKTRPATQKLLPAFTSPAPSTTMTTKQTATMITPTPTRPALGRKGSHRQSHTVKANAQRAQLAVEVPSKPAQTRQNGKVPLERSTGVKESESRTLEQENSAQSCAQPKLSAKAAGKQPEVARPVSSDWSRILPRKLSGLWSPASNRSIPMARTDTDNSSGTRSVSDSSSFLARSLTQNGHGRRTSVQSLFTSATTTTTNVAAQGQIIDQGGSLPVSRLHDNQAGLAGFAPRPLAASMRESRMVVTQPSQGARVPMGRTTSQLRLLLERENSRPGDKSRFAT